MNTEAQINEEVDPQQEIMVLREEVQELRRQLVLLRGLNVLYVALSLKGDVF